MPDITDVILSARMLNCSDIHVTVGEGILFRINGVLTPAPIKMTPEETNKMLEDMLTPEQLNDLAVGVDADFAIQTFDGNRQRVNVFKQKNALASTIRLLNNTIPSLQQLGLPKVLESLAEQPRGLILVTGPTGSGKSTTLAAMIDHINSTRAEHIITIEDPIEYMYEQKKSLIHQREVGRDAKSFASALRSALREDPDIILVGEMRDFETISAALTAAETGHLVMSTLHTTGAAQTIDRIIDASPGENQNQVRTQLAGVLKGVITQCLMRTADGKGRIAATEILLGSDGALNMIRENKCHQLPSAMQAGASMGMHTLNGDLVRLVNAGRITKETAEKYTNDKKDLKEYF